MKTVDKFIAFFTFIIFGTLTWSHFALAAVVYIGADNSTAAVGDTVVAEVRLDTQGATINVAEGEVALSQNIDAIQIREFSDAGSAITLWSRKPSLSADGKSISFVGGVPGGFNQKDALLFKIYFTIKKPASVVFTPTGVWAYQNDGKGTSVVASSKSATFNLVNPEPNHKLVDMWRKEIAADNMPPEFLAATVGRDASMFDNQLYLSIHASDYQSGIDYYEVGESALPYVRTGEEYVLRDQSQQSTVTIRAYDKAGNVRTLVINPAPTTRAYLRYLVVALVLIGLGAIILFVIRTKKRQNVQ